MELAPIVKGAATAIPFVYSARRGRTGGSDSARYCYSVWLRQLVSIHEEGLPTRFRSVADLGPGDSLGVGLAALLTGGDKLLALDIVPYAMSERNNTILRELAELFKRREPIPGDDEFPSVFPKIRDYRFPGHILDERRLHECLAPARIAEIEGALRSPASKGVGISVEYVVPWTVQTMNVSVDLLMSQAVLEHVRDLRATFRHVFEWLVPGGITVHTVDLRSHRITRNWDGHRQYGDFLWKVAIGRRPYLLNRESPTTIVACAAATGLDILSVDRSLRSPCLTGKQLAKEFQQWSDMDLKTQTLHLIARKPAQDGQMTGIPQ